MVVMVVYGSNGGLWMMIMIIYIHKKDTLQILADNKQQSPNLGPPV